MSERVADASTDSVKQGYRPIRRVRFFADRIDWMGPFIIVLTSWYFASQVVVAWTFRPHYSFITNVISDLGNTSCPPQNSFCSPRSWVFNVSVIALGVTMIVGAVLIYSEFTFADQRRERRAAWAAFVFLALAGVGAVLVGAVPENHKIGHLHTIGTAAVIGFGQLAIFILGLALRQIGDWLREFMLVTSLLVLLVGVSIAFNHQFGLGAGAAERLAQYPECVWLILFGFYISRDHYRNKVQDRFRFSKPDKDHPEKGPLYTKQMYVARQRELAAAATKAGAA